MKQTQALADAELQESLVSTRAGVPNGDSTLSKTVKGGHHNDTESCARHLCPGVLFDRLALACTSFMATFAHFGQLASISLDLDDSLRNHTSFALIYPVTLLGSENLYFSPLLP